MGLAESDLKFVSKGEHYFGKNPTIMSFSQYFTTYVPIDWYISNNYTNLQYLCLICTIILIYI